MKKFKFSLSSVHKYKNQILENLQNEHMQILAAIARQAEVIEKLENERKVLIAEFNEKNKKSNTILWITGHKRYIKTLEYKITQEYDIIEKLRKEDVEKQAEVVEAKKETATLDILKEKKLETYQKEVQKSEEIMIDEFVSNKMFSNKNK